MYSKKRGLNPHIYDKNYYLSVCLGSEEFKRTKGGKLHPRIYNLLEHIDLRPSMKVLDVGCGRGDLVLYIAKKVKEAVGIDYSKDAITIANSIRKKAPKDVQKRTSFHKMNIKKMKFPNNSFDLVISIDVFEHLYKEEVDEAMTEIKRILKPNGVLFVHMGTNKILNDFTYRYYTYPANKILTWFDQQLRRVRYAPLPSDPRTEVEKVQHVNEPTYFYLRDLFKRTNFKGSIKGEIGYVKPIKNSKTVLYNALIALYPVSKIFPLWILFSWVFICKMKNIK